MTEECHEEITTPNTTVGIFKSPTHETFKVISMIIGLYDKANIL